MDLEDIPFTLNHHYLSDYKEKFLAYYKAAREEVVRNNIAAQIKAFEGNSSKSPRVTLTPRRHYAVEVCEPCEPRGIGKVLKGLAEMGITGTKPEDIYKILPPDAMAPAINIMADVRAYFQGTEDISFEGSILWLTNLPFCPDYPFPCCERSRLQAGRR